MLKHIDEMRPLVEALTELVELGAALPEQRRNLVDLTDAPECVKALVGAMAGHVWKVKLLAYSMNDAGGSSPLLPLSSSLEDLQDDCDHELEVVLAEAGADGGAFVAERSVVLAPDGGGMSLLGISWSDGSLAFSVLDLDEDPNSDGLLRHFVTPGALFAYLDDYLVPDDPDRTHTDALKAAAEAAGCSMAHAPPIESRAPTCEPTTQQPAAVPMPVARDVYGIGTEIKAAIDADNVEGVAAALELFNGPLVNGSLRLLVALHAYYEHRDSNPARALQVMDWVLQQPKPDDPMILREWLNMLVWVVQTCGSASTVDEEFRVNMIERCAVHGPSNLDIFYGAAIGMVGIGRKERALEFVADCSRLGYNALDDLLADSSLDPIRADGAIEAAIARGREKSG